MTGPRAHLRLFVALVAISGAFSGCARDGGARAGLDGLDTGPAPAETGVDGGEVGVGIDASLDGDLVGFDSSGDSMPKRAPFCDPTHGWTQLRAVSSISVPDFGRLAGISADELSVAWTASDGSIYVADRGRRTDSFGPPARVLPGATALANDRVALAPGGLSMIAVASSRLTFVSLRRSGVGATWNEDAAPEFVNVSAALGDVASRFSEPVLAASGVSFYYLVTSASDAPRLVESTWDASQHAWSRGTALSASELASADGAHRRRPTGASSDGNTLFFFDETTAQERAAWRTPPGSFTQFVDLPNVPEATPNQRCNVLFFQQSDASPTPLFTAQ